MHLVEIGDGGYGTTHVAIERGVTECNLRFVAVVGKEQTVFGGEPREHVGKANSRLDIFVY